MSVFDRYGYGSVAAFYDELSALYSFGRIAETKRLSLEVLRAGDRVFYPGVGRGEEAVAAARRGAEVVAVDVSTAMLEHLQEKLDSAGVGAELIQADASLHEPTAAYDVVVANYFLNLFDATRAQEMIDRLASSLRPGGLLVVADFARPAGGFFGRIASEIYYRPVNWIAWMLRLCALHPILDYRDLLDPARFVIESERRIPVISGANPAFVSIVARRLDDTIDARECGPLDHQVGD